MGVTSSKLEKALADYPGEQAIPVSLVVKA